MRTSLYALALCATGVISTTTMAQSPCSQSTLKGTVMASLERTLPSGPGASMYMESWDGKGNIRYYQIDSNGYATSSYHGTGTYQIGPDCVASVYYDGSTTPFKDLVDPEGRGYVWVNNQNQGVVAAGRAVRVSEEPFVDNSSGHGPCTLKSLKGAFSYEVEYIWNGSPGASEGIEYYDGAGNLISYTESDSTGSWTDLYSGNGTYTITESCVASLYYDGSTNPLTVFVAPDGSGYWWVNDHNVGVVSAGRAIASRAIR
jgi:hypothetical protein